MKKLTSILLTLVLMMGIIPCAKAEAASTKIYFHIRSTSNISSYDINGNVIGVIYPSDECWTTSEDIIQKSDGSLWCKVWYPTSNGTKVAYITYDKIWASGGGHAGERYTASHKTTTYWRSDMSTQFGSIYVGDTVTIAGTYGNVAQVLYPVSGGLKLAWIYTSEIY